jgi:hypothetical protein
MIADYKDFDPARFRGRYRRSVRRGAEHDTRRLYRGYGEPRRRARSPAEA